VTFGLLFRWFEFPHHKRQRAALMPMMVGMMMQAVAVMSVKAHVSGGHFLNTVLYAMKYFSVKPISSGLGSEHCE
jgi:hypothetical protein